MLIHPVPNAVKATSAIDSLNAITLTAAHLTAALEAIAAMPPDVQHEPRAQALTLQAFARDAGFDDEAIAGAALHARATALAKWTVTHDPDRHSAGAVVVEAAARFPLSDNKQGIEFEPAGFQELLLFIEELPW